MTAIVLDTCLEKTLEYGLYLLPGDVLKLELAASRFPTWRMVERLSKDVGTRGAVCRTGEATTV